MSAKSLTPNMPSSRHHSRHLSPASAAAIRLAKQKKSIAPGSLPLAAIQIPTVALLDDGHLSVSLSNRAMLGWIIDALRPYAFVDVQGAGGQYRVDIWPESGFDPEDLRRYLTEILEEWAKEDMQADVLRVERSRSESDIVLSKLAPGEVINDVEMAQDLRLDVWRLRDRIQKRYGYWFVDKIWKWMRDKVHNRLILTHHEYTFDEKAHAHNLEMGKSKRKKV